MDVHPTKNVSIGTSIDPYPTKFQTPAWIRWMKVRFKLQMLFSEPPKKVLRRAKGRSGLSRSPRIPPGGNDPPTATARGKGRKEGERTRCGYSLNQI